MLNDASHCWLAILDCSDETEHFRHSQASAGPAILMTTLEPRQANKKKWNKKTLEDLATKWREASPSHATCQCVCGQLKLVRWGCSPLTTNRQLLCARIHRFLQMLFMAGIEVMCYDMDAAATVAGGSAGGEKQMVVTLQHGWRGYEVRDFLLQQPEVAAVEWDNVKTVPDRYQTKIEVDPVRPAKKAKKSDKKKRKGKQAGAEGKGRAADSDPGEL